VQTAPAGGLREALEADASQDFPNQLSGVRHLRPAHVVTGVDIEDQAIR